MAMKSSVPGSVRRRVFRRDNFRCDECGLKGREHHWASGARTYPTDVTGVWLSIDHRVPKSLGGSHDESNLRTLCTTCNTRKGVRRA